MSFLGWIALFIPNGWHHVQSGSFVEPFQFPLNSNATENLAYLPDSATGANMTKAEEFREFKRKSIVEKMINQELLGIKNTVNVDLPPLYDNVLMTGYITIHLCMYPPI